MTVLLTDCVREMELDWCVGVVISLRLYLLRFPPRFAALSVPLIQYPSKLREETPRISLDSQLAQPLPPLAQQ